MMVKGLDEPVKFEHPAKRTETKRSDKIMTIRIEKLRTAFSIHKSLKINGL